jgi:hypothetical protein
VRSTATSDQRAAVSCVRSYPVRLRVCPRACWPALCGVVLLVHVDGSLSRAAASGQPASLERAGDRVASQRQKAARACVRGERRRWSSAVVVDSPPRALRCFLLVRSDQTPIRREQPTQREQASAARGGKRRGEHRSAPRRAAASPPIVVSLHPLVRTRSALAVDRRPPLARSSA